MKHLACILFLLTCCSTAFSQYYLRGEVKDETGKPLANVKIKLHSSGYIYYSGSTGGFGIVSAYKTDTITLCLDGFKQETAELNNSLFTSVFMTMLKSAGNVNRKRLISFTKDLKMEERNRWGVSAETYTSLVENEYLPADNFPETGFAINIDKAAYSNIRRFINMNTRVPPDAVRVEELLNYFNFGYKAPEGNDVFNIDGKLTTCLWQPGNQLLFLKVCAKKIEPEKIPPGNLVFLVDISGSMDMPNRLPLLKSAFKLLVNNLREKDTISIVVYGSTVGVWLQPTSGKEKNKIIKAIEDMYPGGSTPGASGITQAYLLAKSKFIHGGNNRVILATDGDFNVGQKNDEELEKMIANYRQSGIYLTCLGVGMGNYKDSKLEVLAKKGNGNFAYLDNEKEAEKVLVKEFTQTIYSVADDAFLNIRFNPNFVKNYRLIGFDNKVNAIADSSSELEGGEVGSGHTLMALFEITPPSTSISDTNTVNKQLANVSINYKLPSDSSYQQSHYKIAPQLQAFNEMPQCYRFATSVVMFALLLKQSKYLEHITWNEAQVLAANTVNPDDSLQKEFLLIAEKAKKMYAKKKGRKGNQ